ncbi:PAS domain-containing protein [Anaerolentibacter hominis]|uniref:PAS domain-containing protein n=1 Tax=Anaerolentibacter hominis TaxID=3079009 RepID=UPI0031B8224D
MLRPNDAVKAVHTFYDAYLVKRDAEGALSCLTENIQWIGTGKSELFCTRAQVELALHTEIAQSPEPYRIDYESEEEVVITDHYAVVLLTATVCPIADHRDEIWMRVSAACVEEDGRLQIAAIHASTPDRQQEEGEFFPSSGLERNELERQLGTKALDILGRNIPGGMMGGYLEPDFPLYYVNDYMLAYLGFTYDEFVEAIDGKVINCMHPDDRMRVDRLVEEAFAAGASYEVQYRILKKDGSYIWVNDVGKKGISEDGREVCISVIRDISTEIEARERLEQQAEEQKRQAVRYNNLFDSVLCGIVQYQTDGHEVIFKNANQEAMRLFGYTPQEFWAKRDWDLPGLIVEEDRERVLAEISENLKKPGDRSPFEYRMVQRDGGSCWIIGSAEVILDTDGEQVIQSVFLDINERKMAEQRSRRLEEQVEASNEILHLALEHTTTCEFFYYPKNGVCIVPERTSSIFHCKSRYENMPESFALEMVDEEYRPEFYKMYERILGEERTATCVFRGGDGSFWCRETLSVIRCEEDGTPQFAIGIVEDITHQKEIEQALIEARSRDSLTGLHNKESGVRLIREFLKQRDLADHGVLMLLDMDDFDDINQKEGNMFADAILQEVADILLAETGPDNIQIRLGGDEFLLFVKHCDKRRATDIGPHIADLVQGIMTNTEKNIHVSVSIGMCSTEVADEYNALYRCAESTLKYVKEHGKGQAACYLDTSHEAGVFLTQLYTEEHPVNRIKTEVPQNRGDLVSFALDLLGKAKNLDDAVFLLLSRIGKTYHFDRVSIIEADRSYLSYRFTYQWARSRSDLQLGQDFYASEEDFDICANMYDDDGLADHNVRDGISHIPSCLHAGIWEYGEYAGSMSFETYQENYEWSKEERRLLKELVKIVPSFIMKSKADAVSQAKTDFLSRMSHEIRTPMNAISGMTTIAKTVLDDRDKALDCLNKIESANTYLLGLVNDILDMSRIESGKLELNYGRLDLTQLLASLQSLFHAQALEKMLALQLEDQRHIKRRVCADGLRLNQVLVNIIGNAIKFTDHGGITVRVEELESEPRQVLRFSVTDTGIGIDQAAMSRIFNPFEQAEASTAARRGGTGLGLSISSRLVQMMGGILEVRSEMGQGSEFCFTLSFEYMDEQQPSAGEPEQKILLPDFHGYHVLLAEDNEINREIAETILKMNGFAVTCAADGREAVDLFCTHDPDYFDTVLMDIRMPVMDGLEAARRIRTSGRPDARFIPIIALTANAFDEDTKKSIASGMDGHLSKPIQVEQMLAVLSKCILKRGKNGVHR